MSSLLKGGMVGGGAGAFIGPVHRMAARLCGDVEFVAGAFSSDSERSKASAKDLGIAPARSYSDFREMVDKESRTRKEDRLDFVSVVTPNDSHFEVSKAFLESGFNVICDKPMTISLAQARQLESIVGRSGQIFVLTHSFSGYPMVKEARKLVQDGRLGQVRKIVVEYVQGWLSPFLLGSGGRTLPWRLDPKRSGPAGSLGDVGTHAEHLARYVTGLTIEELCAEVRALVPDSPLDTDVNVLARYGKGVGGIIHASQCLAGEENALTLRVYGTEAGLYWEQENPNYLVLKEPGGKRTVYSKAGPVTSKEARDASFLPTGHPDGYIEAFANLYREAFRAIRAMREGQTVPACDYPTAKDGVESMLFVETVLESSRSSSKWVRMKR